jgi:hypothetical protein
MAISNQIGKTHANAADRKPLKVAASPHQLPGPENRCLYLSYFDRISSTIGTSDDPIRAVIYPNLTLFGRGRPWQTPYINILTLIQESARSVRPTMRSKAWIMKILTPCDIHRHGPGSSLLA